MSCRYVLFCLLMSLAGGSGCQDQTGTNELQGAKYKVLSVVSADSASGARHIDAPAGNVWFILYARDDLGGSYHAYGRFHELRDQDGNRYEAAGQLIGACFSDGPFTIGSVTSMAQGPQVQALSVLFLIPDKVKSGQVILPREPWGPQDFDKVAEFSLDASDVRTSTEAATPKDRVPTPLSDEEFMEVFNQQISGLSSEDAAVKASSTEALRALVKRSPTSVRLLQKAAHSTDSVTRTRASIALEILSPMADSPWRRILEDGRAFTASDIDDLLRAYTVVLAFDTITPHIDSSHHIGFEASQDNALTVTEFVSLYGEPDEVRTDDENKVWHCYGPIGVVIADDGRTVLRGRLLMADAFWAMLYKAAHGEYPSELRVVGLPDLKIKLPSR